MSNFLELGVSEALVNGLKRMNITAPTPIQQATIPLAINGQDLLASAHTGTGKTVAYAIPLIMKLFSQRGCALILTPTRELATQVRTALLQILGPSASCATALLIGGAPMGKQMAELRRGARLIVGTPGRITDHLERGSLNLKETSCLIIDEADRMLDMGFGVQLDKIVEYLPENRQTLMFSATLSPAIEKLSRQYLRQPQRVSIDSSIQPVPKIKQEMVPLKQGEKLSYLIEQLSTREGSIIIFVKTKRGVERLARELREKELNAEGIHGDMPQRRRERVIQSFTHRKQRILVATDVIARGLDVSHVMHVINYDLPQAAEDYIHRIGRTGRAGAEGNALSLVSPEDAWQWREICKLTDQPLPPRQQGSPRQGPSRQGQPRQGPRQGPSRQGPRQGPSRQGPRQGPARHMSERRQDAQDAPRPSSHHRRDKAPFFKKKQGGPSHGGKGRSRPGTLRSRSF